LILNQRMYDIHFRDDISDGPSDCTLLGCKGNLSAAVQFNLFESFIVRLDTQKEITKRDTDLNSVCSKNLERN